MRLARIAAVLFLIASLTSAADMPATPASNDVQADADLRRAFAATAGLSLNTAKPVQDSYTHYLVEYYNQSSALRQAAVRVSEWQLFAANVVLSLVAFLVISGICFSGYQLWVAGRLALVNVTQSVGKTAVRVDPNGDFGVDKSITLEVSKDKVRVQTAIVGVAILVISGVFLMLFLDNVYKIQVVRYGDSEHGSPIGFHETSVQNR